MAVVHELTRGKHGGHKLGAVDNRVQTALKQTDQVFTGIATDTLGFCIDAAELFFGQIAVIAFELLLGTQLQTKVRQFCLAALAVLARPYSRRLTGDLGRPQMFSPIRRSILYLADVRLVTADLLL